MNFSPFLNNFIEQLAKLGDAAFTLVKILIGMLATIFEFVANLFKSLL